MRPSFRRGAAVAGLLALALGCAPRPVAVRPTAGWRVAPGMGVQATLDILDAGQGGGQALRLTFAKTGAERRFVAIEGKPEGDAAAAKALSVWYRLALAQGDRPKLALVVFETDGGAWFRTSAAPLALDTTCEARLPLTGFRRAEFGQDADTDAHLDQAVRFWVGLLFDGPAEGTLELGRVAFMPDAAVATTPLPIVYDDPALWSLGKDPAVEAKLAVTKEGPGGRPAVRTDFAFPGGRHMFMLPALRLQDVEMQGYRGLRFACKAKLPAGIKGLLVSLSERGDGSQYCAEPAPAPSEEWTTTSIPFDAFKFGAWSKDENGRLDLAEVDQIIIGLHGQASDEKAAGMILVSEIELVP